jgi:ornithine--oxo-acid transaminase
LTSRAFYNSELGTAEKYMSETFKYDKVLFMNGGVEAPESAVKFARRWAYDVKRVPIDQAIVLFMKGNFWGRSIAACGSSDDPGRYDRFGPFKGLNFELIEYNNIESFKSKIASSGNNIAAVVLEPIQGERGVIIPSPGYL